MRKAKQNRVVQQQERQLDTTDIENKFARNKEIHVGVAVDTGIIGEEVGSIIAVVVIALADRGKVGLKIGLFKLGFFKIRFARLS